MNDSSRQKKFKDVFHYFTTALRLPFKYVPVIVIDVLDILVNKDKFLLLWSFCPAVGVHKLSYKHACISLCTLHVFMYKCMHVCTYK